MAHSFGFSSSSFDNWWGRANGQQYTAVTEQKLFPNGVTYTTITVPLVRDWARTYFNCSTLPGLPLENSSGSGGHPKKDCLLGRPCSVLHGKQV